ncbi:MAG: chromosomal replication initiator protein DnaA [Candidatus Riflebacteria bacterium]|nr:chromosomal replication initiator protein DnaA [Candidatus Riflebacteria bacterium]
MNKENEGKRIWGNLLAWLRQTEASPTLEAYLTGTTGLGRSGAQLTVEVPNAFVREKLTREYGTRIQAGLTALDLDVREIVYEVHEGPTAPRKAEISEPATAVIPGNTGSGASSEVPAGSPGHSSNLNPEYTMASFIVGKSNAYPHALARSVSLSPGKNYNPLYFYGGVGLGKTHLMQAIGHEILKAHPKARVLYVSSEVFHNEYIDYIQNKKPWDRFRKKYRDVDCLLLDDVQFFESGERIQEEFFHTFNALHQARKQIVLTSDKQPHQLQKVEERLRSRFASGVVADLIPPDLEMRIAILKSRAVEEAVAIPDEVIRYIAERVSSNIRELRAVFRTVVAKASVLGLPLSVALVDETLRTTTGPQKPHEISIGMIQEEVCHQFELRQEDLIGRRRQRRVVIPRQIAMYLCRELASRTLMEIGEAFGKKDHTTVLHSCTKVEENLKTDPSLNETVERLRIRIREKLG